MTNDDRLDELLRDAAARDYNAPPDATPRDEMWERIAAARAARRTSAPVVGASDAFGTKHVAEPDGVIVLPARRWHQAAWARALAAALLLAVGIGVGRLSVTDDSPSRSATDSNRLAADEPTGPKPVRPPTSELLRGSNGSAPTQVAAATPRGDGGRGGARGAQSPAAIDRGERDGDDASSSADSAEAAMVAPATLPYRLAAAQHLALTETLLTAVSADARAGRADSSVALWARDLLGTTRMLLDSPAARDPKLARLLQDLELVLAEVAQLHPTRGSEELRAIDRAVRQRGVLTRLRATMPAGHLSAGT